MNPRILWRSTVFIVTLMLIYLAFPVLIVPSSLPAIKAIIVEGVAPAPSPTPMPDYGDFQDALPIQQVEIPKVLSLSERIDELKNIHEQGMDLILNR
jgi:hypothetical protein